MKWACVPNTRPYTSGPFVCEQDTSLRLSLPLAFFCLSCANFSACSSRSHLSCGSHWLACCSPSSLPTRHMRGRLQKPQSRPLPRGRQAPTPRTDCIPRAQVTTVPAPSWRSTYLGSAGSHGPTAGSSSGRPGVPQSTGAASLGSGPRSRAALNR